MAKYSKRTYELAAEVMAEVRKLDDLSFHDKLQIEDIFIRKFREDSERFNAERWLTAVRSL